VKHLYIIRHGDPHEDHPHRPGDPPLTALGRRQARRRAHRLAQWPIDRIVSSPQQRALDTAAPLAQKLGLPIEVIDDLAEVDVGVPRYRSMETLRREEGQRFSEFLASPARFFGRDPQEYRSSVVRAFESILAHERGQHVAVFSHGMTIKTLMLAVLGLEESRSAQFAFAHASLSRMTGRDLERLRIESINETL
jgi:2,3-bisphosphoglycerate-dependent phosphoglycerate mutase